MVTITKKIIYQIIYPPFVKTPEGILLLHYVGCRHYGDVLQFTWLVMKSICLRKKSSMDIASVGNHLEENAMDISRISPDMLWVPIISKSLRHDYQDNSLRINSYCNSCYSTTNVRWNKLWKCCCLYEHSWLAITAVYIITFHVRAFLVMMKYVDTSIRIKNGCMVGLGSSMMMFLVLYKRGVWSG